MFVISPISGRANDGEPGDLAEAAHAHLDEAELACRARCRQSVSGTPSSLL